MPKDARRPFYWRSFVTLSILLAFLAIASAGIVLYFAPPGRVANWTMWRFLFLTKSQWQTVHTVFAFLFTLAICFHVYFNWKVLLTYLTRKIQETLKMKREIALAGMVFFLILGVSVANVPPSSTVMDFGDGLKHSWEAPGEAPPIPHAEGLSLAELAQTIQMPLDTIRQRLSRAGIRHGEDTPTVGRIARKNEMSPLQVYQEIVGGIQPERHGRMERGGYGRMSLREAVTRLQVDTATAEERLAARGIRAEWDATVRHLASRNNMSPHEIIEIIRGGD